MKLGVSINHYQITNNFPVKTNLDKLLWLIRKPDKNIEINETFAEKMSLEGYNKNLRFSIIPSYNNYKEFFQELKNYNINLTLCLDHFYIWDYNIGSLFDKNHSKNLIKILDGKKEIFNYSKYIEPVNEPQLYIFLKSFGIIDNVEFIKTLTTNPYKFYKRLDIAIDNIKELTNYLYDECKKEKYIINSYYHFDLVNLGKILYIFYPFFKKLEDLNKELPGHYIGWHYYGSIGILRGLNFYRDLDIINPYKISINRFKKIIDYIKDKYKKDIIITEIGLSANNKKQEVDRYNILTKMIEVARNSGAKEVYIWSIMDNFEFQSGYSKKFGIFYDIDLHKKYLYYPWLDVFKKYN
ncbi:hypothetical protein MJ1_0009 [Nanobdella aerobiophila]|uniref:Uncharacterized protein n=1 Tax=Nanobdella aerobiophila TaxID=2586965 RepID=A0A915WSD1_9ARCH|nr:family 1 glycosylhydrolase [Nanobdella aerobiophila]BBL45190.1 hypothetical protein MJ1_0009 [Nanobdella aerobiophila]